MYSAPHYLMAALAAAVFVSEVRAQANCGDRTAIVARLFESYGEVKTAEGVLAGGSAIVEIFSNQLPGEKGRSFTAIVTYPDGRTCIVAAGDRWRYVSDRRPGI